MAFLVGSRVHTRAKRIIVRAGGTGRVAVSTRTTIGVFVNVKCMRSGFEAVKIGHDHQTVRAIPELNDSDDVARTATKRFPDDRAKRLL